WHRTIQANLRHWLPEQRAIVPQTLVGHARGQRHIDHVALVVDQSGSMAASVIYASVFAAVMASLPAVATQLVCFDTAVVDLTEMLEDPVDVLFGIQLGGGTDIHKALTYTAEHLRNPAKTHVVLISDLYEGGNAQGMLAKAREMIAAGVNLIVLLALSDEGRPIYDPRHAQAFAAMGCPVFACTPERFPGLIATALSRGDIHAWAAREDIALVRAEGSA
ncbi:MAG: VWA domain-containing protein, partial [Myxococcota bacterium]